MNNRMEALKGLREFILGESSEWQAAKRQAMDANGWFTEEELRFAFSHIATAYLDEEKLKNWSRAYSLPVSHPRRLGIVMAGNIPLVGFHDFLCGWISGHPMVIKPSSKDMALWKAIGVFLQERYPQLKDALQWAEGPLKAALYIATGSDNSARYFEQYFGAYPHIIRKNRRSVALLSGDESPQELADLAEDLLRYFGLGCRNVSQLYVPHGYDFGPLLSSMEDHRHRFQHHKYRNNYDYYLSLYLLNQLPILTNELMILLENPLPFSPVSVLHYQYYDDRPALEASLRSDPRIQAIIGRGLVPFGSSQRPSLEDFADGVDTLSFLTGSE